MSKTAVSVPAVVRQGVRRIALCVAILLCVVGCGEAQPDAPPAAQFYTTSTSVAGTSVTPGNIRRVRADMPDGYEVADLSTPAAPASLWGFGTQWTAEPAACSGLADPAGTAPVQGLSASGPGGILYAVVAGAPSSPIELDTFVVATCPQFTMASPSTTGTVAFIDPPPVDNAQTIGMASSADTVVEGGTQTSSTSHTYVAYLADGYVAYVALVTDPGAAQTQLDPQFAATLLVKTVSALRN